MKRINPDFAVIGAMKCASTSLADLLSEHPQVYITPRKEPGFFSRDERFAKGIDRYLELYSAAKKDQITGEASTCYSRKCSYPLAPQRLYEHAPDCKLIYIMRNPVKRAYSHYAYIMAERLASEAHLPIISYSEALEEVDEILDASDYIGQLNHWLQFFPRSQLHCIIMEDFVDNEEKELRLLCEFLGIEYIKDSDWSMGYSNVKGTNVVKKQSLRISSTVLNKVPGSIKSFFPETIREGGRNCLRQFFAWTLRRSAERKVEEVLRKATYEEEERVYTCLRESSLELESFLGYEIKPWKEFNEKFQAL